MQIAQLDRCSRVLAAQRLEVRLLASLMPGEPGGEQGIGGRTAGVVGV